MRKPRSDKHLFVLKAIREFMEAKKKSPTLKQIAEMTEMNQATVYYYMMRLVALGLIRRERYSYDIEVIGAGVVMSFPRVLGKRRERKPKPADQWLSAGKKLTKEQEEECFEKAVALAKRNDELERSGSGAVHHKLGLFNQRRVVVDRPKITQDGQSTFVKMCTGCGCQMPHKVGAKVCILCEMDSGKDKGGGMKDE